MLGDNRLERLLLSIGIRPGHDEMGMRVLATHFAPGVTEHMNSLFRMQASQKQNDGPVAEIRETLKEGFRIDHRRSQYAVRDDSHRYPQTKIPKLCSFGNGQRA